MYVVRQVDAEDSLGEYNDETRVIKIKWSPNKDIMKATLYHEIKHSAIRAFSGDAREWALGSRTAEGRAKREEKVISLSEVPEYDLLCRNGLLRFPDPPKL